MSSSHFVVRFIGAIWRGANGLRKVLHLFLMLFLFLMFLGVLSGETPHLMPQRAALYLQPVGSLVEQVAGNPYDRAVAELTDNATPQTLVSDVVDALDYAAADDRIEVVHLELSALESDGRGEVISNPRVVTANQQEATIKQGTEIPVSYTHLTLPTTIPSCRSRWSPDH